MVANRWLTLSVAIGVTGWASGCWTRTSVFEVYRLGKTRAAPNPQAAAKHGEQKDKHESPPDNCDDIFRADFLMNHLSFSYGYFAAALESLNYQVLAANGPRTMILMEQ